MKVQCINIFNEHTKQYQEKNRLLTFSKEYIVLEMQIRPEKNIHYRIIGDDGYTPALFDSKLFKIASNKIPSN